MVACGVYEVHARGGATHGEYKTPQGKLVAVDLTVEDGKLSGVGVTGDFFLEPAEELATLDRALEGAPEDASEEELAGMVREALDPRTEMIGFSPEAIAKAVRRALGAENAERSES
jgi:lipoate-protein ligase A